MRVKYLAVALLINSFPFFSTAQQFIAKGKIEFERKVNIHKQFEGEGEWIEEIKKTIPQYNITYFDFYFDGNKSVYKPGRENPNARGTEMGWGQGPARENIIRNDYEQQQFIGQKQVFETTYLIQDSLRKINWKYTNDTRKIAGFTCRKATGFIMDSVFVFAFFTEEIMVSGGPEGFNGLPGMILGIAIPRIHTTWFATKLELVEIKSKRPCHSYQRQKTNIAELEKTLQSSMKDWGKWAQRNIWQIMTLTIGQLANWPIG